MEFKKSLIQTINTLTHVRLTAIDIDFFQAHASTIIQLLHDRLNDVFNYGVDRVLRDDC